MINSKVKIRQSFLTLTTTDNFATPSRISCHIPMSSTRSPRGRRNIVTILYASTLISMRLFKSAKSGPNGNADTNIVINPYWITRIENIKIAPRRLNLILFYKIFLKKKLFDWPITHGLNHYKTEICKQKPYSSTNFRPNKQQKCKMEWLSWEFYASKRYKEVKLSCSCCCCYYCCCCWWWWWW